MWSKLKNNWKLILITAFAAFFLGYVFSGSSSSTSPAPVVHTVESHGRGATVWTCSMHPQIRMNKPGPCPICGMDLIPATDQAGEAGPRQLKLSETAQKLAEIETAPVVRKAAVHKIRMVGKVDYDETREKTISAWIGGRIDRMFVNYTGAFVKKGDRLVSLYSPNLYAAQQELLQALKSDRERGTKVTGKRLEAVRRKLELLGLSKKQIFQVESRGTLSTHVAVRAPLTGIVVHRNVVEGSYVKVGEPMYRVADLSAVWLELNVYESDIQWVREAQKVKFHVEAYPGRTFDGQVVFVDPILDPKTRSIRVRANVPNKEGLLKPDMFVHAVVQAELNEMGQVADGSTKTETLPLVVPASAPLLTGTRAVVYVAVPGKPGTFEGREITLGPRVDGGYIVLNGLKEGEKVVVKGNFKIDSELQIQAKPSMMYPAGGAPMAGHAGMNMGEKPDTARGSSPAKVSLETKSSSSSGVKSVSSRPVIDADPLLSQVDAILKAYFEGADALSRDNAEKAKKAGKAIAKTLSGIDMGRMGQSLHLAWMPHHGRLKAATLKLAQSKSLDGARAAFRDVSNVLIETVKAVDYRGKLAVYRFHCPMAFGEGADWLQQKDGTANPYFGSKMFKCGSLEEKLHEAAGGA